MTMTSTEDQMTPFDQEIVLPALGEASSIVERWRSVAAQCARQTAVVHEPRHMTYGELERRARRLAAQLVERGVGPESRIGLCAARSTEMIVAMLAILEAGGAYVPLDPAQSIQRLEHQVNDAQPAVILYDAASSTSIVALSARTGTSCLLLETCMDGDDGLLVDAAPISLRPDNLAYVIYTSGSTGAPKGCEVTHRNVLRLFASTQEAFEFGHKDVWPLLHSYAFDFSVWEIFGALLYGGKLVIPTTDEASDPVSLLAFLVRHEVTVLLQTPSSFQRFCQVLEQTPAEERALLKPSFIVLGGERVNLRSLAPWYDLMGDDTVLVNMYGTTETTVHVTIYPVSRPDTEQEQASLIGSPIGDLTLHLLDEQLRPVPRGATGELFG
jgi:amino acid adenylation domain-containing protein